LSPKRTLQKTIEVEKQKFEAVFVNSPASKALLRGPTLIYEKVNDKYAEAMGHRPLLGKKIDEAAPELVSLGVVDAIRNVYHTGEPFVGKAMPTDVLNPKTGQVERHYCDATYSRIADNAGRPYGVYVHAIDITDQVVASRRADELAVSLREAIVSRDAFLSSASHELKTPVTSIKMQLQMTRRHVKPELGKVPDAHKLAKTLDVCGKQVDRLGALVDDLLDVSRIAAGKMTFNFAPVDIGELTRESLQQFGDQIDQACCPLTVDIQAPLMVVCDGFRIEQVIVNLITNAIKYGSCSPITVKAHRREDGGVRISVADRGMGICPNNQSKIFDRFERAIPHGNVSGMGLGLFICRQIIEAHGGQIAVSSELGQGSVFTVDLPADPGT
jgi:signal transduction histidine kinase